jgi:hypothetical protein
MDDLRRALDDEAQWVSSDPDMLQRVRNRARRRSLIRQVGTGVLALSIAGAGFAVAVGAFRGPSGLPMAGPTSSLSPSPSQLNIVVAGSKEVRPSAMELSELLLSDGYEVMAFVLIESRPDTTIRFPAWNREEALRIREKYLPGATLEEQASPYHPPPDITITVGADYEELRNGAVQVRVLDAGGGRSATDTAAGQLQGAGYDVVEVGNAPSVYDESIVACAPQHDEAGLRILQQFFPTADFRGEIPSPDHDVTVYVASDWAGS